MNMESILKFKEFEKMKKDNFDYVEYLSKLFQDDNELVEKHNFFYKCEAIIDDYFGKYYSENKEYLNRNIDLPVTVGVYS